MLFLTLLALVQQPCVYGLSYVCVCSLHVCEQWPASAATTTTTLRSTCADYVHIHNLEHSEVGAKNEALKFFAQPLCCCFSTAAMRESCTHTHR